MSDKTFLPYLFGKDLERIVREGFQSGKGLFGFPSVRIAEVGGRVAGMLLAYTFEQMRAEMASWGSGILRSGGLGLLRRLPGMIWRALFARRSEEPRASWVNPSEFYLANMAVYPEFRRQGLGRMLLGDTEQRAQGLDCTRLALDVEAENLEAVRLYEHYGFRREQHNLRVMGEFEFLRFNKEVEPGRDRGPA